MKNRYLIMSVVLILAGSGTQTLAKSDTAFLTEAIQINLAEISVGDLAQKSGGSDDVKSFGKMLVDDHTASNTKATSLAQSNGVTPPTEPKAAEKQKHDELAKLSGADFDREFAKAMVKGHEGDDDIAKFAQETLPTLQKHLKTAQTLQSGKSAQGEVPAASEAAKRESEMAPSGAAKTEAAPPVATKTEPSAMGAEKMAGVPSDAVGVNDYYMQNVYDRSYGVV
jgi:putative membrane protein